MLFVFEGMDGVGKTTLINELAEHYRKLNHNIIVVHPFGTSVGRKAKKMLMDKNVQCSGKLALARLAGTQLLLEIINPLRFSNPKTIIFCDRFVLSTMVYQTDPVTNFENEKEIIQSLNEDMVLLLFNSNLSFIRQHKPITEDDSIEEYALQEQNFQTMQSKYLAIFNELDLKKKFLLPVHDQFQTVTKVTRILDNFIEE